MDIEKRMVARQSQRLRIDGDEVRLRLQRGWPSSGPRAANVLSNEDLD